MLADQQREAEQTGCRSALLNMPQSNGAPGGAPARMQRSMMRPKGAWRSADAFIPVDTLNIASFERV